MSAEDSHGTEPMVETVRVLVPLWIGPQLFAIGDTASLPTHHAEALRLSGRVEIIL